jgi:hypothetical protein
MAEVAIRRNLFAGIVRLIAELCLLAAPMSLAWVHESPAPRNWHCHIRRKRQSRPQQGRHPVDVG